MKSAFNECNSTRRETFAQVEFDRGGLTMSDEREICRDHRRYFHQDSEDTEPSMPGEIDDEDDGNWSLYR